MYGADSLLVAIGEASGEDDWMMELEADCKGAQSHADARGADALPLRLPRVLRLRKVAMRCVRRLGLFQSPRQKGVHHRQSLQRLD